MQKQILSIAILFLSFNIFSQTTTTDDDLDSVQTYVEVMPVFPGGENALNTYLSKNINYPAKAVENSIQGKVVIQFVVKKDGSIGDVKVAKSLSMECDAEALRVIKGMPAWIPGTQNGKKVNVSYRVPIKFILHDDKEEPKKKKEKEINTKTAEKKQREYSAENAEKIPQISRENTSDYM